MITMKEAETLNKMYEILDVILMNQAKKNK
nr:MAG TPA: hypothetical protein [Caudoviricetes sp.]